MKARYLERGDRYFQKAQYREAVLEYQNAFRIDNKDARTNRQLGLALSQSGEVSRAYLYLLRASEANPADTDVNLKLGTIYLLAGKTEDARARADIVLEKDPGHLEALVLLANASSSPQDVETTLRRVLQQREALRGKADLHMALGLLYLRKKDMAEAEREFQEAVRLEPQSVEGHLALANFYAVKGDRVQVEAALRAAVAAAPPNSSARLRLAAFYRSAGKLDEAKKILRETTAKASDYLPAWRGLAEIALQENKLDDARKVLDTLLKKSPSDLDGHLLLGRLELASRKPNEAVLEFGKVLKLEPRLAVARFNLARAQLELGNIQQAKSELAEAVSTAPNFVDAIVLLARLNLGTGAVQPAIDGLERLVATTPSASSYDLLGSAYLEKRDAVKATEAFRRAAALSPQDPRGLYLVGVGLLAQGKRAEARKGFEAALERAPDQVDPLKSLASMSLQEGQPEAAIARVKQQIARVPASGAIQALLGDVYFTRDQPQLAEAAYLRALDLDANLAGPYTQLGIIYGRSKQYDQALAKLDQSLKINAKAVPALMIKGIVLEQKGDKAQARATYEEILNINPRFAPAANNLAGLLVEQPGGDLEKALQLAQIAKEQSPEDPRISDTLGWILYKRGIHQRALTLFKESAAKLPDNPEVQYHLGLAYLKAGEKENARSALAAAVRSPVDFPGKEEARKTLAGLN